MCVRRVLAVSYRMIPLPTQVGHPFRQLFLYKKLIFTTFQCLTERDKRHKRECCGTDTHPAKIHFYAMLPLLAGCFSKAFLNSKTNMFRCCNTVSSLRIMPSTISMLKIKFPDRGHNQNSLKEFVDSFHYLNKIYHNFILFQLIVYRQTHVLFSSKHLIYSNKLKQLEVKNWNLFVD